MWTRCSESSSSSACCSRTRSIRSSWAGHAHLHIAPRRAPLSVCRAPRRGRGHPQTVTPAWPRASRARVNRARRAQSFAQLLRRSSACAPGAVAPPCRAGRIRPNVSLDHYGIPARAGDPSATRGGDRLDPDPSLLRLEEPGPRFTTRTARSRTAGDAMGTLRAAWTATEAGYRWTRPRTLPFGGTRPPPRNLATGCRDYLGIGVGAVSTSPSPLAECSILPRYLRRCARRAAARERSRSTATPRGSE